MDNYLTCKTSHSVYKEIAQVIHLPSPSYVLRKTKDLVRAQCVKNNCAVNLRMVETMSEKLIYADDVIDVYGSLGFDDMYIKAGIGWNINQTNIVGMDPQLSYDVITNEFRKSTNDTVQDTTDKDKDKEDEVILDKIPLAKHHVVFKFTPFDNKLRKSSFIVASESIAKVTPGRL